MNKLITGVVVGLVMGACSAVSAQSISAGGGVYLGYDVVGQGASADYTNIYGQPVTHALGYPTTQMGLHAFLDATFVEVGVGIGFGSGKERSKYIVDGKELPYFQTGFSSELASVTTLGISVLGKYNVPVREGMEVFPAIGFEYQLCLGGELNVTQNSQKNDWFTTEPYKTLYGAEAGDLSYFALKLGVGYDYILSGNMFVRALALYNIGFPSEFSKIYADKVIDDDDYDAALVQGISVKLGIGFKF